MEPSASVSREVVGGLAPVARYELAAPRAVLPKGLEERAQRGLVLAVLSLDGLISAHLPFSAQLQDHITPVTRGPLEVGFLIPVLPGPVSPPRSSPTRGT